MRHAQRTPETRFQSRTNLPGAFTVYLDDRSHAWPLFPTHRDSVRRFYRRLRRDMAVPRARAHDLAGRAARDFAHRPGRQP